MTFRSKEITEQIKRIDAVNDGLNKSLERINGNNGAVKILKCPRCGKEIRVPIRDPFACECGWPKPNGDQQ